MHSQVGPELIQALAAFQAQHSATGQSGFNGHSKYHYATLGDVLATIQQAKDLAVSQLTYSQPALDGSLATGLRTILMHSSGQCLVSEITLPEPKAEGRNWEQAWGSTLTYWRKYALLSIAGLANEDDDAQGAHEAPSKSEGRKAPQSNVVSLERSIKPAEAQTQPAKQKVASPSKATPYIVESKEALKRKSELEPKLKQLKAEKPDEFIELMVALVEAFPSQLKGRKPDQVGPKAITLITQLEFLEGYFTKTDQANVS